MPAGVYSESDKELLDDSLVGKLCNFTSKNKLKREVTGNCATQRVLQHSQDPHRDNSIMSSRRVLGTNVEGEVGNFFLVGKHLFGVTNLAFDIGSKRNF
jgi:hypothetical protein